jgi:hypothetical protein
MGLFRNSKPSEKDRVDILIWRSSGWLGGFRMGTLISIVEHEKVPLLQGEFDKILDRYWAHCERWKIPYEVMGTEIVRLARAAGRDPGRIFSPWWERLGRQILGEQA